jgi:hypothetical protein
MNEKTFRAAQETYTRGMDVRVCIGDTVFDAKGIDVVEDHPEFARASGPIVGISFTSEVYGAIFAALEDVVYIAAKKKAPLKNAKKR